MRRTLFIALLLLPVLVQAHPGHGPDSGFIAGAAHPLTGVDHLVGILMAGFLLGWLPALRRWFACAAFLEMLGVTHAMWTPQAGDGSFITGLLASTAALIAAGMLLTTAATRLIRLTAASARSRTWAAAGSPATSPCARR